MLINTPVFDLFPRLLGHPQIQILSLKGVALGNCSFQTLKEYLVGSGALGTSCPLSIL